MAKAKSADTLSSLFQISPKKLKQLGVPDLTLGIDTRLFIDPGLLESSSHSEFKNGATATYKKHFQNIIKLLKKCSGEGDVAWKAAYKQLDFPEVPGTCLGYGAGSIHGRGWGPNLRTRVLRNAREIVKIGVEDPDLFALMALFEEDMGPDRISDMTTNIVAASLIAFNERVLKQLGLKGEVFQLAGVQGEFLRNPLQAKRTPIVLLPSDILRKLPVVTDWSGVSTAAHENVQLRQRVNKEIGRVWEAKVRKDKQRIKERALASKAAFEALLESARKVPAVPYNAGEDPDGLLVWATVGQDFAKRFPVQIAKPQAQSVDEIFRVVKKIIEHFKQLVEHQGLNKDLYTATGKPRHEGVAQRLFFAVASAYCKANDIDISPEIDTGTGKIDFKFSTGFNARVLVEVKLSTNQNVLSGYTAQLEEYKRAQQTTRACYLLIDVGRMGKKDQDVIDARNAASKKGQPLSDFQIIDAIRKPPPSKLKP